MADSLTFLSQICGALKKIKRTGWVRHNIPLPESDSDHMHRCAMCAMLVTNYQNKNQDDNHGNTNDNDESNALHPNNVNTTKLLKMALTHDLCEAIAGDITPFCSTTSIKNKHHNEELAMIQIRNMVGVGTDPLGHELYHLWKEYEEQITVEAIYCKDIDKFEMVLQAFEYEEEHLSNKSIDGNSEGNSNSNSDRNEDKNEENVEREKKKIKLDSPCTSTGSSDEQRQQQKNNANEENGGANGSTIPKNNAVENTIDSTAATTPAIRTPTGTNTNTNNITITPLRSFFITTNDKMKTPLFRKLDAELRQKRELLLKERGWEVTEDERQQYH